MVFEQGFYKGFFEEGRIVVVYGEGDGRQREWLVHGV